MHEHKRFQRKNLSTASSGEKPARLSPNKSSYYEKHTDSWLFAFLSKAHHGNGLQRRA
jgi:hypothetical protein